MIIGEISVEVLAYTKCPNHDGYPLLTVCLDIPRYLLAQINTHRMLSKNTQSSRAVPWKRMVEEVPTYVPSIVGFNHKGMQSIEFLEGDGLRTFQAEWLEHYKETVAKCQNMQRCFEEQYGKTIEKGIINRLLEPFKFTKQVITGLVSPKGWLNFIALRAHGDAQSEMQIIGHEIKTIIEEHKPNISSRHLPFTAQEHVKESVVNCATISYRNEQHDYEAVNRIYKGLVTQEPLHASVFEHQGFCRCNHEFRDQYGTIEHSEFKPNNWIDWSGNFHEGQWYQLRKLIENNATGEPIPTI